MAEYAVKAPDGKTITLQGPDGASEADIIAQAQALYTPAAPKAAAPRPANKPAPRRQSGPNPFLEKYNAIRGGLLQKVGSESPDVQRRAMQRFDSDPRAQKLRQLAGLAELSTPKREVQAAARKTVGERYREAGGRVGQNASRTQSFIAGLSKGMFGIPQHIQAGILDVLPSELTGIPKNANYSNILETIRGRDDAAIDANFGYGLTGEIGGGLAGAGPVGGVVKAAGARLAASGAPMLARAGNVLQELVTLRKGQKLANTAKIVAAGAGAGGAQAAGTGGDVAEGAALGAAGAPLVVGGVKVAQVLTRPFRDVLRLSSAGQILSRLTTASRDQLERLATQYRSATGAEPTLFELLPLADRNKILKQAVVGKDNIVEQTSNAIRARAQNLGPEMSDRARQILQPQRDAVQAQIRADIARARGGALAAGDDDMIAAAMDSPTDMLHLRDQEARAIMAPHGASRVVDNLEDLFPHVPGPGGTRVATDPEVANVIRSAAGTMRSRAPGGGVLVDDITDMISTLRGDLGKGGIEGRTAERAINHLQDVLDSEVPAAGAAAREMTDAYAARSRMAEGMREGDATRLRNDVQVGSSRRQARTVRNAYDTPEGEAGRALGQGNRIQSDLGGSPEEALRATVKQSRGSTGRQLAQNVGPHEAERLATAARAQDESAQALAAASNKAQSGSGDSADAETLVQAIAGLHPSSFITTKAGALRRLFDMTYIPESRARTMIDMLFSQDPAMMRRALRAIGNEPNGAKFTKYLSVLVGQAGGNLSSDPEGGAANLISEENSGAPSVEDDLAGLEAADAQGIEAPVTDSPYSEALQNLYASESPDLIELVQRVKQQESGGDQSAVSSAGAVGVMQVMPDTAPEAAALAGLPWDENAYRTDAAYNELIGIAYLSELLRKYDGNVELALAAYNAGPGRVDAAISENNPNWLASLPAETQDYVARVA